MTLRIIMALRILMVAKRYFIVGMPRTGTTVVERLISQPENITSAGEMQHFSITLKQMSKTGTSALLDLDVISATENIDLASSRASLPREH